MGLQLSVDSLFSQFSYRVVLRSKGVFGLTFGFWLLPPSQKPTKGLDPGNSFF
jgi:hypothetical protein